MTTSDEVDRLNVKQAMIDLRHLKFGVCLCDMCRQRQGWEMHEWITRRKTEGNPDMRQLSFQPEICSILCNECHPKAETVMGTKVLIDFNIELYGILEVETALSSLPELFWPRGLLRIWKQHYAS